MKKIILLVSVLMASSNVYSHGITYQHSPSHKHGIAELLLNWQGTTLTATAVYPAQDVVGFEHIPTNAKEKRKVRDAYQKFIDQPTISSEGCKPKEVKVNSALFNEHADGENEGFLSGLLGGSTPSSEEVEETEKIPEHMDFEAVYTFMCDAKNKALKFDGFTSFSNLKLVNIHYGKIDTKPNQQVTPKNLSIISIEAQ